MGSASISPLEAEISVVAGPDRHLDTDHLRANLATLSARSGVVTIAAQVVKFALMMGSTVFLARLLTPRDYGLVGMVTVLTGFIGLFKDVGLSTATIQQSGITHRQVSTLFWMNAALGCATTLTALACAPLLAYFYREPRVSLITVGLAGTFLINGLTVQHQAILQRQMRFTALATIDILSIASSAIVAISLAFQGYGYWSLVYAQIATAVVGVAGAWIACRWRPAFGIHWAETTPMLRFGTNLTGFHILNYFARHLDNALIGRFWGSGQLGIYDKAYQMLLLPITQLNAPVTAVAMPALSRLAREPEAYRTAYRRILEKVVVLTLPSVIFMVCTADWLVGIVLGPKWSEVTPVFIILGLSGPAAAVCDTCGWLFVSQGRTADMFKWGTMGAALIIAGIAAGVHWGAVGVATGYSFTVTFGVAPLLFWFVTRKGPIRQGDFYGTAAPVALATAAMAATVLALRARLLYDASPILGLLTTAASGAAVFLVGMLLTPRGRSILFDVVHLSRMLRRK